MMWLNFIRRFSASMLAAVLLLSGGVANAQFMQGHADGLEKQLQKHVDFITADSLKGREAGSRGELAVANYIYDELEEAGVIMLSGRNGEDFYIAGSIAQGEGIASSKDTIHSRNMIGVVQGYDPVLRNEYIVIGAHIDHLGVMKVTVNGVETEQIYPGADDNASGVATIIELAKQISANKFMFRRSVVFAFFGAEEVGMAGSWYFLNRSFHDAGNIVMMINLDMVGRSGKDNKPQIFTGVRNIELNSVVNELSQRPLSLAPEFASTDYFPSDHRVFAEKGIPVALLTTGVHRDYHTPRDLPHNLDYTQMEKIAEFAYSLALNVANRNNRLVVESVAVNPSEQKRGNYYTQHDVDKRATFLHGDETCFLEKWVYPYIKYPESAVIVGESGRVVVEFIIEKDGRVTNVLVVNGVSDDIDAEAVKVILASPKWKPAKLNGENVRVKTAVAIDFKLSKNAEFKLKK